MSFDWFIDNIIWIALWYFIVFHMAGTLFSQKMLHSNLSKINEMKNDFLNGKMNHAEGLHVPNKPM